jgi:RHH-type proline utilization regulon transcriptional repressor/proline dehydrogenase/delta 1-pyrroline-5-carboxylate dehydrogenase
MPSTASGSDDLLTEEAIASVGRWLTDARAVETRAERTTVKSLHRLIEDPAGLIFTMGFVDRVARPDATSAAAHQLASLVGSQPLPSFLSPLDRQLLRAGAFVGPRLPDLVVPLALRRLRGIVGHLVVDAEPEALAAHLATRRRDGFAQNVNLLGEAVLGEREADRRLQATAALVDQSHVDYVSVKVSAIASQLNYWDWDGSLDRIVNRLLELFRRAAASNPPTFVNLDMEEYHDLEITIAAFKRLLDSPEFFKTEAGIVLQTYLPDSFDALRQLIDWATGRHESGGGGIKIRLVKGANLAMERVDAAIHGWEQAPYHTKAEVDANYKRCLDWALRPDRTIAVRLGVASHNLFDVAWAHLLAERRGLADRIDIEMLQGMAPAQARTVKASTGGRLLLYTPIVRRDDFDVAISYLFRRLEENAQPGNFLRSILDLDPAGELFAAEADRFRTAVRERWDAGARPQRQQVRPAVGAFAAQAGPHGGEGGDELDRNDRFVNEPDTDPTLPANRRWAAQLLADQPNPVSAEMLTEPAAIDAVVGRARQAAVEWAATAPGHRRRLLLRVADELARSRGKLISCMVHEAGKTLAQADPEVSEAIDFARYYGDRAEQLGSASVGEGGALAPSLGEGGALAPSLGEGGASFVPLGVVAVVPPWNFPVAIPAGGALAALAAGNAVILKPAPQTPRCAELVAEACWAAGIPPDVLQFTRTPDDEVGQRLVTSVDGVILTGSVDTARLFLSWKPDLTLFAETSGKNAMIITPHADIDLAVADLVASAFGHAGQKCSAASLAICVGDVYESPRFRRQLVDSIESLDVGRADLTATSIGPLIERPGDRLERGLTTLDDGEGWLVEPQQLGEDGRLWRPGVRLGVKPGSWFHRTECFGPVLGVVKAADLTEAIAIQNSSAFGLTGGLHSLDAVEIDRWSDAVEVGNAYVNRGTTGAIVRRQPFGGWKRSSVGPGAKAGGPNYVAQLGTWCPTPGDVVPSDDAAFAAAAAESDQRYWRQHFSVEHDPTGLFCEANLFRYRRLPAIGVRIGADAQPAEVKRVLAAAVVCSVPTISSTVDDESDARFIERIVAMGIDRVRVIGTASDELRTAANDHLVHLANDPVTVNGRIELLHYLREQAISRTLHRFGNVLEAGRLGRRIPPGSDTGQTVG